MIIIYDFFPYYRLTRTKLPDDPDVDLPPLTKQYLEITRVAYSLWDREVVHPRTGREYEISMKELDR